MKIPDGPDDQLSREATAAALTAAGFPISPTTLATLASRPGKHGGPPYRVFNKKATYRWGDALQWAESLASATRRTASEHATPAAA